MEDRLRIAVVLGAEDRDDMERFTAALDATDGVAASAIEMPAIISDRADFIVVNLGPRPEAKLAALPPALWPRLVLLGVDRARVITIGRHFIPAAMAEYTVWRDWVRQPTSIAILAIGRDIAASYQKFADLGDSAYVLVKQPGFTLPMLLADCLSRLNAV